MLYTAVHIIHSILYGIVVAVCADMDMHMDMEGLPELSHYEHRSNNESLIAYFGFPQLGIVGPFYFISVEALLTLALMLTDLYRANSGKRNSQADPTQADLIKDALDNSRL